MVQRHSYAAMLLLMASALFPGGSCHPFQIPQAPTTATSILSAERLIKEANGGKGSMHAYREDSPGLSSHEDVVKGQRAHASTSHDVVFIAKHRNMDELTRILHDVSDPTSQNYGNHLTRDEIYDLTFNPEAHEEIIAYLKAAGAAVSVVETTSEHITARAPIGIWERMLDTEFYSYTLPQSVVDIATTDSTNTANLHTFVRTEKYSVPLALDSHVAFVMNTVQLPQLRSSKTPLFKVDPRDLKVELTKFGEETELYASYVTPQLINNIYNIDSNVGHPRATQAAYETVQQLFSPEDLLQFQQTFKLPIRETNASYGGHLATAAFCKASGYTICAEGNLDIMYMLAMADTPTIHWYSDLPMAWYLFDLLNSPKRPPLVISMSYGSEERYLSESEFTTFENSAKKLGLMGVTILVASGDDGAAPQVARRDITKCRYMPSYPTSCPYVISVGATQVTLQKDYFLILKFCTFYTCNLQR